MKRVLIALDLKDVVNGTSTRPESGESAQKKQDMQDAKAAAIISESMELDQEDLFMESETSKDMWDLLAGLHGKSSETNKIELMQKFHACKLEAGETIMAYIARTMNTVRQLIDAGEKVSETAIMAKIICGLPEKYSSLMTAWDSVEPARQKLAYPS